MACVCWSGRFPRAKKTAGGTIASTATFGVKGAMASAGDYVASTTAFGVKGAMALAFGVKGAMALAFGFAAFLPLLSSNIVNSHHCFI